MISNGARGNFPEGWRISFPDRTVIVSGWIIVGFETVNSFETSCGALTVGSNNKALEFS
jgi:hypothetical protein